MMNRQVISLKPEHVLKRVTDTLSKGATEKEKRRALESLHAAVGMNKKRITWSKIYQELMEQHIALCVDLKDHIVAKDGLHQYRNLCQAVDPSSLESIVTLLINLAEQKATAARAKADKVSLAAAAKVADLDQEESPESIMLSSMTEAGAKDRTDREVVVPWLKFLWESYRAVLELLYRQPKLEKVYHRTCEKAFKFCLDYHRVLEFRRLCDMLRMQLSSLQKSASGSSRARLQWEWTAENIEFHLQTRFAQLEVASSLEMWNEGFRTVEDIYGVMVLGKKTPKPKLMITYYEKLARIFWVADNKLFHAYALFKYYCLCTEHKKDMKADEKRIIAANVLLAALTVPSLKDIYVSLTTAAEEVDEEEEEGVEKSSQMASLLDFKVNPSRQTLLADIISKGVIADALPEIAALYENLEEKFHPLTFVRDITESVATVKNHATLKMYAAPLKRIVVLKLAQQLGRVYSTVKLEKVHSLLSDLGEMTPTAIEQILVEGVAKNMLQLRVNHLSKCIQFTNSSSASTATDTQVSQLGSRLNQVLHSVSQLLGGSDLEERKAAARKAFNSKVAAAAASEYTICLKRKAEIELRKEGLERVQLERQEEERRIRELEQAKRQKEEQERLEAEEAQRNLEKKKKLQEKMELARIQKELERHGVSMEESAIAELDQDARRSLIMEAQADALKAKEEENRKLSEQAKRLDHITRALRIEGAVAVSTIYEEQLKEDRLEYEQKIAELEVTLREQFAKDLLEKKRMQRMQALRQHFEGETVIVQRAAYERHLEKQRLKLRKARREQVVARARELRANELARIEEEELREHERLARIEEERIQQEEYERLRVLREKEEEAERERAKRDAERKEQMEKEARLKIEEMQRQIREAEEAAAAKKPATEDSASSSAPAARAGAYVAPSQRGGGVGGAFATRGGGGRDFSDEADRSSDRRSGGGATEGDWGRRRGGPSGGGDRPVERGGDRWERSGPGDRPAAAASGGGGGPPERSWGRSGGPERGGGGGGPERGGGDRREARGAPAEGDSWSRSGRNAPESNGRNRDRERERGDNKDGGKDGGADYWRQRPSNADKSGGGGNSGTNARTGGSKW